MASFLIEVREMAAINEEFTKISGKNNYFLVIIRKELDNVANNYKLNLNGTDSDSALSEIELILIGIINDLLTALNKFQEYISSGKTRFKTIQEFFDNQAVGGSIEGSSGWETAPNTAKIFDSNFKFDSVENFRQAISNNNVTITKADIEDIRRLQRQGKKLVKLLKEIYNTINTTSGSNLESKRKTAINLLKKYTIQKNETSLIADTLIRALESKSDKVKDLLQAWSSSSVVEDKALRIVATKLGISFYDETDEPPREAKKVIEASDRALMNAVNWLKAHKKKVTKGSDSWENYRSITAQARPTDEATQASLALDLLGSALFGEFYDDLIRNHYNNPNVNGTQVEAVDYTDDYSSYIEQRKQQRLEEKLARLSGEEPKKRGPYNSIKEELYRSIRRLLEPIIIALALEKDMAEITIVLDNNGDDIANTVLGDTQELIKLILVNPPPSELMQGVALELLLLGTKLYGHARTRGVLKFKMLPLAISKKIQETSGKTPKGSKDATFKGLTKEERESLESMRSMVKSELSDLELQERDVQNFLSQLNTQLQYVQNKVDSLLTIRYKNSGGKEEGFNLIYSDKLYQNLKDVTINKGNILSNLDLLSNSSYGFTSSGGNITYSLMNNQNLIFSILNSSSGSRLNISDDVQNYIRLQLSANFYLFAFNTGNLGLEQEGAGISSYEAGITNLFILNTNNGIIPLATALANVLYDIEKNNNNSNSFVKVAFEPDKSSNEALNELYNDAYVYYNYGYESNGREDGKRLDILDSYSAADTYVASYVASSTKLHVSLNLFNLKTFQ